MKTDGKILNPEAVFRMPLRHATNYGQVGSVEDAENHVVAQVQQREASGAEDLAYRQAGAAMIAMAVNAHGPFVDALREIGKWGCVFDFSGPPDDDVPRFPDTCARSSGVCAACTANAVLRKHGVI